MLRGGLAHSGAHGDEIIASFKLYAFAASSQTLSPWLQQAIAAAWLSKASVTSSAGAGFWNAPLNVIDRLC